MSAMTARPCSTCGSPVPPEDAACGFCRGAASNAVAPPSRPLPAVIDAWARSVFGAPRAVSRLVTRVEVRDETFQRLFTDVVRREIREERAATYERLVSAPRLDPRTLDPFSMSIDELRAKSRFITNCGHCRGSGSVSCALCSGSGKAPCSGCNGSGQELRVYKKSSRLIKCTVCRGKQTVQCAPCGSRGVVGCAGCESTGHQIVWLTFVEAHTPHLVVPPQNPILEAHRQLAEVRPLKEADAAAFTLVGSAELEGPLERNADGVDPVFLDRATPPVDRRCERIAYQQYVCLAVIRRDAIYQTCGVEGTVSFSGTALAAAPTRDATFPFRLRLWLWVGVGAVISMLSVAAVTSLVGATAYFDSYRTSLMALSMLAAALGTFGAGAVLREIRPGFRLARLSLSERGALAAGITVFGVAMVVGIAVRPRAKQVDEALATGHIERAAVIVDALEEIDGKAPEVAEARDALMLARAGVTTGDERLKLLDAVVEHKSQRAAEAATLAKADRIARIRGLVRASAAESAVTTFEQWFPAWKEDPELVGVRAEAKEAVYVGCAEARCRYVAALDGRGGDASAKWLPRLGEAKRELLSGLVFTEAMDDTPLSRLKRLRAFAELAGSVAAVAAADAEIAAMAKTAVATAAAERARTSVLGSGDDVAAELLGPITAKNANTGYVELDGVATYLVLDAQRKCRGAYAVGVKGARGIRSATWSGDRLLSAFVGRAATVRRPASSTGVSRWAEGATPVVARWREGSLIELRVGDATP